MVDQQHHLKGLMTQGWTTTLEYVISQGKIDYMFRYEIRKDF